jgi:PIN domain nuclease of toxin-antitoxin system
MAEYVLDTHACVFALSSPRKLGSGAHRALDRADGKKETVWVPAAVVTEILMLKELGRTDIGLPALQRAFDETSWRFLPLDLRQLDEFAALAAIRDPFDRLIVSAARCAGARLISRDENLRDMGLVDVVWK